MKVSRNNRRRQRFPSGSDSSLSDMEIDPNSDEYSFIVEEHPSALLLGLKALRDTKEYCDVTIEVEGVRFFAHKNVLAAFSPYFKAMFQSRYVEAKQSVIEMKSIDVNMMQSLLDFAYTSRIRITKENCQNLLSAANLLQVISVKNAACQFLENHMDTNNCLGIHCFAESHACQELQRKSMNFALKYFWLVSSSDEFLKLPFAKLIEFTSNEKLEVEKEEWVFSAVYNWLLANPEERKDCFHRVLETIRLPLIDPYFLHDCIEKMPMIASNPECVKLVEEAKLYHLLPDRRAEMSSVRLRPRLNSKFNQVKDLMIVAVGGEDDKVVLRSVEYYYPPSGEWSTLASLPFAISKHGLVVSGTNYLYLAGGEYPDGKVSDALWRYDTVLDQWQEMASMQVPRSELGLVILDGYIYAICGCEQGVRLDSVERYDPSLNRWDIIHTMGNVLTSPAVVAHGGMLYILGGAVADDGDGVNTVQRYDPRLNEWTEMAPMIIPRSGAAACVLGNFIYVVGGWHASTENTNRVERYDIKNDMWEKLPCMQERRYRPGIAVVDGKIYVLGGEEGWDRYIDTIECYDPETNEWTMNGTLLSARSWLGCVTFKMESTSSHMMGSLREIESPSLRGMGSQALRELASHIVLREPVRRV